MEYSVRVESETIQNLEEEKKYLELTNLIIDEIRFNYEIIKEKINDIDELTELYNSVSYLGKDNGLMAETEKRILALVKYSREKFINIFEKY